MVVISHVGKHFGGVRALDDVSIDIRKGETHCIVGQNGAGKSTLLKILGGFWRPDSGKLILDGKEIHLRDPSESRRHGILLIPQDPFMVDSRTVAENIFLTNLPKKLGVVRIKELIRRSREILAKLKIPIDPRQLANRLSIVEKELVAIARALAASPRIILFDEPTAFFSQFETKNLFEAIKELKRHQQTVVFVGHRLKEILEIADRISVLRDGKHVGTFNREDMDLPELSRLIARKDLKKYDKRDLPGRQLNDEVVIEASNLSVKTSNVTLRDISFQVHKSEILGVAGLVGAGKSELLKTLSGQTTVDSGKLFVNGKETTRFSFRKAWELGIRYMPEDRIREGLCLNLSIADNIVSSSFQKVTNNFAQLISRSKKSRIAREYIEAFSIKASSERQTAGSLSGGNQQKVLLANKVNSDPLIFLIDEPTHGIDIGAKAEIYEKIRLLRSEDNRGITFIIASSELSELTEICDRILILSHGKKVKETTEFADLSEENMLVL